MWNNIKYDTFNRSFLVDSRCRVGSVLNICAQLWITSMRCQSTITMVTVLPMCHSVLLCLVYGFKISSLCSGVIYPLNNHTFFHMGFWPKVKVTHGSISHSSAFWKFLPTCKSHLTQEAERNAQKARLWSDSVFSTQDTEHAHSKYLLSMCWWTTCECS